MLFLDPLRPLWPALGIVGVIILILIFMSSYFLVELVTKKKKMQTVRNSGADSPGELIRGYCHRFRTIEVLCSETSLIRPPLYISHLIASCT